MHTNGDAVRQAQKAHAIQFGRRLKWARQIASLSATGLGAEAGVDASAIRHIEQGDRLPSIPLLLTLCDVLQVSPCYLLYGDLGTVEPARAKMLRAEHPELRAPQKPPRLGKRGGA